MPGNSDCAVYVGNLNEKVDDSALYEILLQAGRVVDLYIPRDKETNRPKGFAFAEYETEEIADYAVRLFSGFVTLNNRTLKFEISGRDKSNENLATPKTPASNSPTIPRAQYPMHVKNAETFQLSSQLTPCRFSAHTQSISPTQPQGCGLVSHGYKPYIRSGGYEYSSSGYDYSRRVFSSELDTFRSYDGRYKRAGEHPIPYPSYR